MVEIRLVNLRTTEGKFTGIATDNIWKVKDNAFMDLARSKFPRYIPELFTSIKEVGMQALGNPICVIERKEGDPTIEEILTTYPGLSQANATGLLSKVEIIEGIPNITFRGNGVKIDEVSWILPYKLKLIRSGREVQILIPEEKRKPIIDLTWQGKIISDNMTRVEKNPGLWFNIANYFKFKPDEVKGMNLSTFLRMVQFYEKTIIPLAFGRQLLEFTVNNPEIRLTDGKKLSGTVELQAASLFEKGNKEYPSRILVHYDVYRRWEPESKVFVNNELDQLREYI